MADFQLVDHGSIVILTPRSDSAHDWVDAHIDSERAEWCGGVVIEPRYVGNILAGINSDGLSWER